MPQKETEALQLKRKSIAANCLRFMRNFADVPFFCLYYIHTIIVKKIASFDCRNALSVTYSFFNFV